MKKNMKKKWRVIMEAAGELVYADVNKRPKNKRFCGLKIIKNAKN